MKFYKLRDVKSPVRGTKESAGLDFFIPDDWNDRNTKLVKPGESLLIPSGIKANVPKGFALIAFNKSGIAVKKQLYVGACVVDEDYQGEIHINVSNVSRDTVTEVSPGDKIMQFLLLPINYELPIEVNSEEELWKDKASERGTGGFGSTGTN